MPIRTSPNAGPASDLRKQQPLGSSRSAFNGSVTGGAEGSAAQLQTETPSASLLFSTLRDQMYQNRDEAGLPRDISAALTYGLELVRYGAMLVAVEGRPHLANRAALAILDKKDGLSLERTGLVADRASDTRLLLKLLQNAIRTPELGEPKESPVSLPRKTARTSLIVRVFPGPGQDCWPGTDNRAALMMLYDQDMALEVNAEALSKLYGLTRGEAALAAVLVRGKSIEEAAEELFISPHTARTHLKRIFMKTDTHRQTELVVRIFPAAL